MENRKPVRIVFGGQSGCGKSTLVTSLFKMMEGMNISVGIHEIDVYSDTIPCILGLKPWNRRRKKTKAWYEPTIRRAIEAFALDQSSLVLGDLPGKISNPFLKKMISPADKAVIVFKTLDGIAPWRDFFQKNGLEVIYYVSSDVGGQLSIPFEDVLPPNTFHVRDLKREIVDTEEILQVCRYITAQVSVSSQVVAM